MYDTVVFPTDGRKASETASDHALDLAEEHDASLYLVYVVEEAVLDVVQAVEDERSEKEIERELERGGRRVVDEVAESARDRGLSVETEVRRGEPRDEIAGYSEEVDADLVVMGTEERPEEYRDVLGSTTERVLRASNTPVLVVKT